MTKTTGIDAYIGFAVRAKKATFGLECLLSLKQTPGVVLYDETLGQSAKKKAQNFCESKGAAFLPVEEGYLNRVLKRNNVKIVAITDGSLADQIKRISASGQGDTLRR